MPNRAEITIDIPANAPEDVVQTLIQDTVTRLNQIYPYGSEIIIKDQNGEVRFHQKGRR